MTAVIISHGSINDMQYHRKVINRKIMREDDLIICADGGAYYAQKMGLEPHAIIGDFDSCDEHFMENFKNSEIIKHFKKKDKTDTELAVDYAIEKNQKYIILLGSIGSRLDHTLANFGLLKMMFEKGVKGEIIDDNNQAFLVSDRARINGRGCFISLIPFWGDVSGVTLKGFEYPLSNDTLKMGSSRGVSNVLQDEYGEIEIKNGLLLVVKARE